MNTIALNVHKKLCNSHDIYSIICCIFYWYSKQDNNKSGEFEKYYMKIRFDSDNKLPLNKQLKILSVTIVIRFVLEDGGKYYLQAFVDDCLYEL